MNFEQKPAPKEEFISLQVWKSQNPDLNFEDYIKEKTEFYREQEIHDEPNESINLGLPSTCYNIQLETQKG